MQWRGGLISELFKNKGSSEAMKNYRDILFGDHSGKSIANILRPRLFPIISSICVGTQFGSGLNGGETAFAHIYLRLFNDFCASKNVSSSVVFFMFLLLLLFYTGVLFFYFPSSDEEWLHSLRATGFSEAEITDVYNDISNLGFVFNGSCTPELDKARVWFAYAQELYNETWISMDSCNIVSSIAQGSSAGMPLADLIFNVAMSKILIRFQNKL